MRVRRSDSPRHGFPPRLSGVQGVLPGKSFCEAKNLASKLKHPILWGLGKGNDDWGLGKGNDDPWADGVYRATKQYKDIY